MKKSLLKLSILISVIAFSFHATAQITRSNIPVRVPQIHVRDLVPNQNVFAGVIWHNLRTVPFKVGGEGSVKTLMCPENAVVSGLNVGGFTLSSGCGDGWKSGCGDVVVVGSAQLVCSYLATVEANLGHLDSSSALATTNTGENQVGAAPVAYRESCLAPIGVAMGLVGRSGDWVDSLGLACGNYFLQRNNIPTIMDSPFPYSISNEGDYPFGAFPGFGGNVFEQRETTGEALVGVSFYVNESNHQVSGVQALHYGTLKKKFVPALFPVDTGQ